MARDRPAPPDPHFDYKHEILKNVPGFSDQRKLDKFERIATAKAILNLQTHPVEGRFDATHIRQIHLRIFQNVYPWAGEFRQINMNRPASFPFAMVPFLEKNLNSTFENLAAEGHLRGLDADAFAMRAACYLGELNSIHPFREGNGRTQRGFIRELAAEAGHRINWIRVTREQMYDASIKSHNLRRNAAFAALIGAAIKPVRAV